MRLMTVAAVSAVVLAGLAAVGPASAQSPRNPRVDYYGNRTETITVVDEFGRRHTRITVRPRSFLDPGNEVGPGTQHYTDYTFTLDRRGTDYLYDRNDPKSSWSRMPFPTCFDLPGYCR